RRDDARLMLHGGARPRWALTLEDWLGVVPYDEAHETELIEDMIERGGVRLHWHSIVLFLGARAPPQITCQHASSFMSSRALGGRLVLVFGHVRLTSADISNTAGCSRSLTPPGPQGSPFWTTRALTPGRCQPDCGMIVACRPGRAQLDPAVLVAR